MPAEELAEGLGITAGTLSKIENGKAPIKRERYRALASILAVDLTWFREAESAVRALMGGVLPGEIHGERPREFVELRGG